MHIYLLYDTSARVVKIGKTQDFSKRISTHLCSNLSITNWVVFDSKTKNDENMLHRVFSSKVRLSLKNTPTEWFDLSHFDILVIYKYFNNAAVDIKGSFFDLSNPEYQLCLRLPLRYFSHDKDLTFYQKYTDNFTENDRFSNVIPTIDIIDSPSDEYIRKVYGVNFQPKNGSSMYKGVSRRPTKSGRYTSSIYLGESKKKVLHLGSYETAKDAAYAYDNKARELYGESAYLNFPHERHTPMRLGRGYNIPTNLAKSGFRGVQKVSVNSFKSGIYPKGKYLHLGSFKTAEEAARAYDAKAIELYGKEAVLNFPE